MNEITTQAKFNTLQKAQANFLKGTIDDLSNMQCSFTEYGRICGVNLLAEIMTMLAKQDIFDLNEKDLDLLSIRAAIQFAMTSELNCQNKEIFVSLRKVKYGKTNYTYKLAVECKPQYKGHLKLISKFGVGVAKIYPIWIVREGDDFTYATFKGIEQIPPTWSPKGYINKVVRVVVPIRYKDSEVQYHIAERESVATNLKAQIKQNTLGLEKTEQVKILTLCKDMTLDQMLDCKDLREYINPTYTGISSEEMIITKLVINATKRVQIDYGNAFVRELVEKTFDNADVYTPNHNAKEVIQMKSGLEETDEVKEITTNEIKADEDGVVDLPKKEEPKPTLTPQEYMERYQNKVSDEVKDNIAPSLLDDMPF